MKQKKKPKDFPRPKTIAERYAYFEKMVYRNGMLPEQKRQIEQSFYAGAFEAFLVVWEIKGLDPETSTEIVVAARDEVNKWIEMRTLEHMQKKQTQQLN